MTIRVEGKDHYEWIHGHKPRGTGYWGFQIANEKKFYQGTFTDAQKRALAYAKKNYPKIYSIKVLS